MNDSLQSIDTKRVQNRAKEPSENSNKSNKKNYCCYSHISFIITIISLFYLLSILLIFKFSVTREQAQSINQSISSNSEINQ